MPPSILSTQVRSPLLSLSPGNTRGNETSGNLWRPSRVSPRWITPLPSLSSTLRALSVVVAATVMTHGASLWSVAWNGPLLPAAQLTRMPCSVAARAPTAMLFRW
ncbi:unnamed protein product [Spirodela intermedia]|uniref:Uncharacterized protein n=1 Tax=Spirodela intermedia TaxID=51605 RepID=A0A7I8L8Y6_SPIIN|nr:unnamed protein product [Spirodela intermedia]